MPGSILVLTIFFTFYALTHSLLASTRAKAWARHRWGARAERWYRLGYNSIGIVLLLPLLPLLLWLPDRVVYQIPAPWWWLTAGVQGLAVVGFVWAFAQTDIPSFLGLSQVVDTPGYPSPHDHLVVDGFYCWSRHPLYTFSMVILWLNPYMTSNSLTLTILSTGYFYIGSIVEERRLRATFGPAYTAYQRRVARFLFRPWKCKKWGFAGN